MELTVNTNKYEFKYIDIIVKYDKVNTNIEYYRWESIRRIKEKILDIFIKNNIKPIKNDLCTNIDNVVARILFENFSSDKIQKIEDGLMYYKKNSRSLFNDLKTTFYYKNKNLPTDLCNKIINTINLEKEINCCLNKIKNMNKKQVVDDYSHNIKMNKTNNHYCIEIIVSGDKNEKFKIPMVVYNKLKKRYLEYKSKNKHDYQLDELITCLMMRYNSLSSIGNQMGIPINVKNKFKKCDIDFEGFASSFNHYCKYYCSMFYDIEKYFGSLGPYQNITYIKGIYMLNPPYEKNLLNNMVLNIIKSLNKSNKKLCFMFGTPTWEKYENITFHDNASASKYFKLKFIFKNYQVLWYDFLNEYYTKIPSSTRYILANYDIDLICMTKSIKFWISLKD
jgi:hypothetical protein